VTNYVIQQKIIIEIQQINVYQKYYYLKEFFVPINYFNNNNSKVYLKVQYVIYHMQPRQSLVRI